MSIFNENTLPGHLASVLKECKRVMLKKITSSHANLRTETVAGLTGYPPVVGFPFCIYADSLDPSKDYRKILTSPVTEIQYHENGTCTFKTRNSTYTLEEMSDEGSVTTEAGQE